MEVSELSRLGPAGSGCKQRAESLTLIQAVAEKVLHARIAGKGIRRFAPIQDGDTSPMRE